MINELERCRQWIEDALERGDDTHDYEDIVAGITSGKMQLWPAKDSCLVTEIIKYPKKKAINMFLIGGKLDTVLDMEKDVIEWAKAQKCDLIIGTGRKGWKKVLSPLGYQEAHITMAKEI